MSERAATGRLCMRAVWDTSHWHTGAHILTFAFAAPLYYFTEGYETRELCYLVTLILIRL